MIYKTAVWHSNSDKNKTATTCEWHSENSIQKLSKIQNKCLQIIAETYKVISITAFKTETHISFLDFHLNIRLAVFRQQHKNLNMKNLVKKTCEKMRTHFWHNNMNKEFTRKKQITQWVKKWRENHTDKKKKTEKEVLKKNWKKCWKANLFI